MPPFEGWPTRPLCAILTPATSTRRGGEGVFHLTVISRTSQIAKIAVVAAATTASLFVWQSALHTGVPPLSSLWPRLPGFATETVDVPPPGHSTGGSASSSSRGPVGVPLRRAKTHVSTPLPNRTNPRPRPAAQTQPPHPPLTGSQPALPNPVTPTAPTPTAPTPTAPSSTAATPIPATPAPEPATKAPKSSGRTLALQRADHAGRAKQQQPVPANTHVQPQSPQPPGRARAGDHPHPSTPGPSVPRQSQEPESHASTTPQSDQQPAEPHSSQPPPPAADARKAPGHAHP
jgi:hypothetical protein